MNKYEACGKDDREDDCFGNECGVRGFENIAS